MYNVTKKEDKIRDELLEFLRYCFWAGIPVLFSKNIVE